MPAPSPSNHRYQEIVSYARQLAARQNVRRRTLRAECPKQRPRPAAPSAATLSSIFSTASAPDVAEGYLRGRGDSDRVLSRQLNELLELIRQYGAEAVPAPSPKPMPLAPRRRLRRPHPPPQQGAAEAAAAPSFRDPRLNELARSLSLLAYDAFPFLIPERNA